MKKNQRNLMIGGLALGGLYLLTKSNSSSLGPTNAAASASSAEEAGVTPGLFYYISESTEWNDFQIIKPAIAPETPTIIIPYTYSDKSCWTSRTLTLLGYLRKRFIHSSQYASFSFLCEK